MIKRIHVKKFRSLKDCEFSLGLNNVLVGPNASGKTNILDALRFLCHIASAGVAKALNQRLGFSEVAWKGAEPGPIQIVADFELPEQQGKSRFQYEIEIDGTALGLVTIQRERLTVHRDGGDINLIDFALGHGSARHLDGTKAFDSPGNPAQSALELNVPGWAGTDFKAYLASWQFHQLNVDAMRNVSPAGRMPFLTESGNNLASWLATLRTSHSEHFQRLEQAARDVFPGLQEITTELTPVQTTFISSRDEHLNGKVNMWGLASGELCFLALGSLILAPPEIGAPMQCVEEIENHLNPRLIETLMHLLRQWQAVYLAKGQAAQIFVTTHSPFVVDQFGLDELLIVEKHQGATQAVRAQDKPHLRELLQDKEQGLGDLWYSGALGGV